MAMHSRKHKQLHDLEKDTDKLKKSSQGYFLLKYNEKQVAIILKRVKNYTVSADIDLPKILCIDDDEDILDSLARTLRRRFSVYTAATVQRALLLFDAGHEFTVIICDQRLNQQNGLDFLKEVKTLSPFSSRVLLSGQVDLKTLEAAVNESIIHKFIMKPWESDHLLLHIMEGYRTHQNMLEKAQLKILSITDPITQLTNHRFFQEKIRLEWDKLIKNENKLSLILIDIDHFKKFNDRYGHPEGDRCLALVADKLKATIPKGASLSRYGGEEFALILPNCTSLDALTLAEKLRGSILQLSFNSFPLSISLGVATAPEHASSVDELIISADQSLYQAKRRGRNQTVVGLGIAP